MLHWLAKIVRIHLHLGDVLFLIVGATLLVLWLLSKRHAVLARLRCWISRF